MDITAAALERLGSFLGQLDQGSGPASLPLPLCPERCTVVTPPREGPLPQEEADGCGAASWFGRPLAEFTAADLLLAFGAVVISEVRQQVFEELGFTVSAGERGFLRTWMRAPGCC